MLSPTYIFIGTNILISCMCMRKYIFVVYAHMRIYTHTRIHVLSPIIGMIYISTLNRDLCGNSIKRIKSLSFGPQFSIKLHYELHLT